MCEFLAEYMSVAMYMLCASRGSRYFGRVTNGCEPPRGFLVLGIKLISLKEQQVF